MATVELSKKSIEAIARRVVALLQLEPARYPQEGLATISEGMQFLKCGRTKIYELINSGLIETIPMGRDKRIKWASLWRYANGE